MSDAPQFGRVRCRADVVDLLQKSMRLFLRTLASRDQRALVPSIVLLLVSARFYPSLPRLPPAPPLYIEGYAEVTLARVLRSDAESLSFLRMIPDSFRALVELLVSSSPELSQQSEVVSNEVAVAMFLQHLGMAKSIRQLRHTFGFAKDTISVCGSFPSFGCQF